MQRLKHLWIGLRDSFWFVPSLIVVSSIALAVGMIEADSTGRWTWMENWPRVFGAGADGSRGMLATIAGSMMTVVGVTFSMTLMTLALASNQYTSRILRNFMGDRVTQVVLGIFAGIFTYCLLVLRTIRGGNEAEFVPGLSVAVSVVLAIGGIGTLIYFIHHIAASIQASSIIASVATETLVSVDRLFPEEIGEEPEEEYEAGLTQTARRWQPITAPRNGYIQGVDNAALVRLAREQGTIVRMESGIGDFVVRDATLAWIAHEAPAKKETITALQAAYSIDRHRTVEQDAAFGIRQIVDIALRALSPSVNDTTTAIMCVDYLKAILARLAARAIPASGRYEEGELRLIATGPTFACLVADSFDQIRTSAEGIVGVLIRMLDALEFIGGQTSSPRRRRVLREKLDEIAEVAARTVKAPHDRVRVERCQARVREALEIMRTPLA